LDTGRLLIDVNRPEKAEKAAGNGMIREGLSYDRPG